jgi:hypothetical protein
MQELNRVALYRDHGPFWLTEAFIKKDGGISICSGDSDAEWYINIEPKDVDSLLHALEAKRKRLRLKLSDQETGSGGVLTLLRILFASDDNNPFETIKVFLAQEKIPWKHDFYGSI